MKEATKLLEAAKMLQELCEDNNGDCSLCPFTNGEGCGIGEDIPSTWALNDKPIVVYKLV